MHNTLKNIPKILLLPNKTLELLQPALLKAPKTSNGGADAEKLTQPTPLNQKVAGALERTLLQEGLAGAF